MIFISETAAQLARSFALEFKNICDDVIIEKGRINLAISGGNTPKLLFEILATDYKNKIDWERIFFYWADERCVSPVSIESNYGMIRKILFEKINIPDSNIYRIHGENDPASEAVSYSELIKNNLKTENGFPKFDLILLGMGDDGHTASIFPDRLDLLNSEDICAVAAHPESKQKRITLTGNTINNADKIYFLVTGKSKSEVIFEILEKKYNYLKYPSSYIHPNKHYSVWYLDKEAASLLKIK
ncbi:MAG TPA: 6-phosphogluconolactonase [Ignavibacteria bacterium]|nr:6-phosphogluconolactonase [Ignavibacteria bacterium]